MTGSSWGGAQPMSMHLEIGQSAMGQQCCTDSAKADVDCRTKHNSSRMVRTHFMRQSIAHWRRRAPAAAAAAYPRLRRKRVWMRTCRTGDWALGECASAGGPFITASPSLYKLGLLRAGGSFAETVEVCARSSDPRPPKPPSGYPLSRPSPADRSRPAPQSPSRDA